MAKKFEVFDKFLEENKITCFSKEALNNEYNTVIYRAHMEVAKQNLPTMVTFDDYIYIMIQVLVSQGTVTAANEAAVETYINALNKRYKPFKYCIDDGKNIVCSACVVASDDGFEPAIVNAVIGHTLQNLTEEYPKLMAKVWAE